MTLVIISKPVIERLYNEEDEDKDYVGPDMTDGEGWKLKFLNVILEKKRVP